ncbi:hypothetical protein D3C80_1367090 [compost metagenome]
MCLDILDFFKIKNLHIICLFGVLQTVRDMINGDNTGSSLYPSELLGQQADRTAAQDNYSIPGLHTRTFHAPPGGRYNVREEEQLLILHLRILRHHERSEIAVRHSQQFCLTSGITSVRIRITKISAGILGLVGMVALAFHLMLAEITLSAGYVKRDDHTVAFFNLSDLRSHILNNPHRLMPDNIIIMHARNFTVIDMQV